MGHMGLGQTILTHCQLWLKKAVSICHGFLMCMSMNWLNIAVLIVNFCAFLGVLFFCFWYIFTNSVIHLQLMFIICVASDFQLDIKFNQVNSFLFQFDLEQDVILAKLLLCGMHRNWLFVLNICMHVLL